MLWYLVLGEVKLGEAEESRCMSSGAELGAVVSQHGREGWPIKAHDAYDVFVNYKYYDLPLFRIFRCSFSRDHTNLL